MTREEAIKVIRKMLACTDLTDRANLTADMVSACNLAIKALEQEPCEDAISRQAVLDLIADYDLSMGQVVSGIHALLSVTPQEPRWIPVSERLPEAIKNVLVTSVGGYVYISRLVHGEWEYGGEVVAWMPLPKSYSEVEE